MKCVDTIARIQGAFLVQGWGLWRSCASCTSRGTVPKVLRSGETAFDYARTEQPHPKLGPWRDELERLLAANAEKSARERLTLIRVFEELRGLGYAGGYDAVRRFARRCRCDVRHCTRRPSCR